MARQCSRCLIPPLRSSCLETCKDRKSQNSTFILHILQNSQVTSNKMVYKQRHHFLAQFYIPFHMMCSVLLRVIASKMFGWKLLIGCQTISTIQKVVFQLMLATKQITQCERVLKNVLENGVFSWVPFSLRSLGRFERCVHGA